MRGAGARRTRIGLNISPIMFLPHLAAFPNLHLSGMYSRTCRFHDIGIFHQCVITSNKCYCEPDLYLAAAKIPGPGLRKTCSETEWSRWWSRCYSRQTTFVDSHGSSQQMRSRSLRSADLVSWLWGVIQVCDLVITVSPVDVYDSLNTVYALTHIQCDRHVSLTPYFVVVFINAGSGLDILYIFKG